MLSNAMAHGFGPVCSECTCLLRPWKLTAQAATFECVIRKAYMQFLVCMRVWIKFLKTAGVGRASLWFNWEGILQLG